LDLRGRKWREGSRRRQPKSGASSCIIRVVDSRWMRWAGHVVCIAEMRNVYKILVGKPEKMRPLGRRTCRWKDNNRMDIIYFRKIGWKGVDQWRAPGNTTVNPRVP